MRVGELTLTTSSLNLFSPDAERVCYAVDVVEPRSDERDLENPLVVKPDRAQALVVIARDARGIPRQLHHIVQHGAILIRQGRARVIVLELADEIFVQCDATQKLCVGFDSIMAAIIDRNQRRNHLVLSPCQRQIRRHQRAEGGEGVMKRFRNQAVRSDDA